MYIYKFRKFCSFCFHCSHNRAKRLIFRGNNNKEQKSGKKEVKNFDRWEIIFTFA